LSPGFAGSFGGLRRWIVLLFLERARLMHLQQGFLPHHRQRQTTTTNSTNSSYNVQFPHWLASSLFFSTLLLGSRKPLRPNLAVHNHTTNPTERTTHALETQPLGRGLASYTYATASEGILFTKVLRGEFQHVPGITDLLPGSRNGTPNSMGVYSAGICSMRGASRSVTAFIYLRATYFREERCVLVKMCL